MKKQPKPPAQYATVAETAERWGLGSKQALQRYLDGNRIPGVVREQHGNNVRIRIPIDAVKPVSRRGKPSKPRTPSTDHAGIRAMRAEIGDASIVAKHFDCSVSQVYRVCAKGR